MSHSRFIVPEDYITELGEYFTPYLAQLPSLDLDHGRDRSPSPVGKIPMPKPEPIAAVLLPPTTSANDWNLDDSISNPSPTQSGGQSSVESPISSFSASPEPGSLTSAPNEIYPLASSESPLIQQPSLNMIQEDGEEFVSGVDSIQDEAMSALRSAFSPTAVLLIFLFLMNRTDGRRNSATQRRTTTTRYS